MPGAVQAWESISCSLQLISIYLTQQEVETDEIWL